MHKATRLYVLPCLDFTNTEHKLQKDRPFFKLLQNVINYKTTQLFEIYAMRRVGEIGPLWNIFLFVCMWHTLITYLPGVNFNNSYSVLLIAINLDRSINQLIIIAKGKTTKLF